MAKISLLLVFCAIFCENSLQDSEISSSDVQFVCGSSKQLLKCGCYQETDRFEHIPLFSIDCSRLDFRECPSNTNLPTLMGHLDLSHNYITYLIDTTQLASPTLYYFDASYNQIKFISDKFFMNLTRLTNLNLGHNQIENLNEDIFAGLDKLQELNLEGNKFKVLPTNGFKNLIALNEIMLGHNDLSEFLQSNKLCDYMPDTVTGINLNNVNLKNITHDMFQSLQHLKKLSVAYNPLQELPSMTFVDLEYLDISGTNISKISEQNLMFQKLKILKLNRLSYLTKLNSYAFFNIPNIKEIHMEHCIRLKEIDGNVFGIGQGKQVLDRYSLEKFSVRYSGLTTLPTTFGYVLQDATEVHLRGNDWNCDCKLKWFVHLMNAIKDYEDIRCKSPDHLSHRKILNLTEADFVCIAEKRVQSSSYTLPVNKWLFPLVGVLTIIVLVLIGFLIYLGPYGKYASTSRSVGPESPYSPITICPNKAEIIDSR